jgi:chloramphenicol 3-O-phosphotransferase
LTRLERDPLARLCNTAFRTYDLEIDTTQTTPAESAERIRDAFGL